MDMTVKSEILAKYQNGNTVVSIYEDGTKIREYEDYPVPFFPESIDIKITNYCDMGCQFCHESSTIKGKHADLEKLKAVLGSLPAGVELALGGGNPLDHPDLMDFLIWCQVRGLICNMTVNQRHLSKHFATIETLLEENLIKGLGISINGHNFDKIKELKSLSNNIVYHVIAGVHGVDILNTLYEIGNCKVLILGFKKFGRGTFYYDKIVENNIIKWKDSINNYLGKFLISFDNLALFQLNIKSHIDPEVWKNCYMGDDFTFTMYIDAVKQEYAPTSRSERRVSFNDMSLFEYFINNRKK